MKKILIMAVLFVVIMGGAYLGYNSLAENYAPDMSSYSADGAQIAKDITVKNAEGEKVNLSDYFGKPIVLNFWATWCGPCQAEMPDFENMYKKYGDEVEFMMVNQTDGSRDTVEKAKKFIEDAGYSFPVYFDTTLEASVAYHVTSIPRTIFINADGTVLEHYKGMMSEEILQGYIDKLLA